MSIKIYKECKSRVIETLNSKTQIEKVRTIPKNEKEFTFDNGIRSWVGSIFVDIRDSTNYFENNRPESVARVMRAFTREIILILSSNDKYREIGIRGDCVYAIYTTPEKDDLHSILSDAAYINSFNKMFQELLQQNNFDTFKIGIGLGCSEDLVIKSGAFNSGISDKIWIGSAVTDASNLSSFANKDGNPAILMNSTFHYNVKDTNANDKATYGMLFDRYSNSKYNNYYGCNLINSDFNEWIENGMR